MVLLTASVIIGTLGTNTMKVRADDGGHIPSGYSSMSITHAADCECMGSSLYVIPNTTHKFEAVAYDTSNNRVYPPVVWDAESQIYKLVKADGDTAWYHVTCPEGYNGYCEVAGKIDGHFLKSSSITFTNEYWTTDNAGNKDIVLAEGATKQLKLYARHYSVNLPLKGEVVDVSSWSHWSTYSSGITVSSGGALTAKKTGSGYSVLPNLKHPDGKAAYSGPISVYVLKDAVKRTDGERFSLKKGDLFMTCFVPKSSGEYGAWYRDEWGQQRAIGGFMGYDEKGKLVMQKTLTAGQEYVFRASLGEYADTNSGNYVFSLKGDFSKYENSNPGEEEVPDVMDAVKKGETVKSGDVTYKVTASDEKTKTVEFSKTSSSSTSVTIPASVELKGVSYKVTLIAENAFKGNTKITKVTIGNNVKSIGSSAFYGCKKLKTVTVGSGVTSIGSQAFANCSALTTVKGVSKVTEIGNKAFYKCAKLVQVGSTSKTVTLSKVKTIGDSAFNGCKAIQKVNLTSTALTKIGSSAFGGCTAMTSFTEKSAKLSSIGSKAFYGDKKLAAITLKSTKLTKSNVKSNAFKGIKNTCKFKVPSSQVKSYKTIFQSKGAGKKIKVTK